MWAHLQISYNCQTLMTFDLNISIDPVTTCHTISNCCRPKQLHPRSQIGSINQDGAVSDFFRRKQFHLWKWCQNSATGGAELRTMKRFQGVEPFWLQFVFLSAI